MGIYMYIGLFIIGLLIIIKGGDIFVDSAVWVAKVTGIPNIIIGATIVSLATTLPELFVSSIATIRGAYDMAIGNAIGSIICNTGLILSLSMIFMPGAVDKDKFMPKTYIMIVSTILMLLFCTDGRISIFESICLFAVLVFYVNHNLREARQSIEAASEIALSDTAVEDGKGKISKGVISQNIFKFILGAVLIVIGARLLVNNAQIIAGYFDMPEGIISLTVIALGTSLPELVTTITSIVKKEGGVAVGNIIGANILNMVMIVSTCGIISGGKLAISNRNIFIGSFRFINFHQTLLLDIPIAILMMLLIILPIVLRGKYERKNGIMLLGVYIFYIVFLYLTL